MKMFWIIIGLIFIASLVLVLFLLPSGTVQQLSFFEKGEEEIKGIQNPALKGGNSTPIGYNIYNDTVEIWNNKASYYFNKSSGIQFTQDFDYYWTKNVFCLGYYNGEEWVTIKCADELSEFNRDIHTDNSNYINATLWKDITYGSYDLRLGINYYLGLTDENLTITLYGKNIGIDIPFDLGFAWKVKDIKISRDEKDTININDTTYSLDENLNLTFKNMTAYRELFNESSNSTYNVSYPIPFYVLEDNSATLKDSIRGKISLEWDKDLDYMIKLYSPSNQTESYVVLLINAGKFDSGVEKSTTIYWEDPLTDDLIAYWKLDDASGDAIDAHSTHDGSVTGSPYGATGKIGDAYVFSGDDYVQADDSLSASAYPFTINAWVNVTSAPASSIVIFWRGDKDYGYFYNAFGVHGTDCYPMVIARANSQDVMYYTTSICDSQWHMLTAVYEDNTNRKVYVDGDFKNDTSSSKTVANPDRFAIGRYADNSPTGEFVGKIDEVGYWESSLSAQDISDLYNSGNGLAYPFSAGEDTTPPNWTANWTSPVTPTYFSGQNYFFNVTWSDADSDITSAQLQFDNVNYTMSNLTYGVYNYTITNYHAGTFTYYFWANDTSNNKNTSIPLTYVIEKHNSSSYLWLNNTEGNITLIQNNTIDINGTTPDYEGNAYLYLDNVLIQQGTTPLYNSTTNFSSTTSMNVTVCHLPTQNYTSNCTSRWVDIEFPPDTTLPYFDESPLNQSFVFNSPVNYDINASDETAIEGFMINDSRFSINSTGWISNLTHLGVMLYWINITINDTSQNMNSTEIWFNFTRDISVLTLTLNETAGNFTSDNQTEMGSWNIPINSTITTGEQTINVYVDTILNKSGASPQSFHYNFTNVKSYNITSIIETSQNYTSSRVTRWADISEFIAVDSIPPYFTNIPLNSSYTYTVSISKSVNATDNIAVDCFTINDTRFSINCSGWITNTTQLGVDYYWVNVSVNDSSNNWNSTYFYMRIMQTPQAFTPYLNGISSNLVTTYPTQVNATHRIDIPPFQNHTTLTVTINGTEIKEGVNYTIGAGFWIVNWSAPANQNWSAIEKSLNITMNQSTQIGTLYINQTSSNFTSNNQTDGGSLNIYLNASITTPCILYNNGTNVAEGSSNLYNITNFTNAGEYNITLICAETQNYTYFSTGLIANITEYVGDIIPPYFDESPLNQSFVFNDEINYDINASDETRVEGFMINDSRFSINSSGWITNLTQLGVMVYWVNITINDTSQNMNSTEISFTITQDIGIVSCWINQAQSNYSNNNNSAINVFLNATSTQSCPIATLWNNGSLIATGVTPLYNITNYTYSSDFNVTAICKETQNYTFASETWWAIISNYTAVSVIYSAGLLDIVIMKPDFTNSSSIPIVSGGEGSLFPIINI